MVLPDKCLRQSSLYVGKGEGEECSRAWGWDGTGYVVCGRDGRCRLPAHLPPQLLWLHSGNSEPDFVLPPCRDTICCRAGAQVCHGAVRPEWHPPAPAHHPAQARAAARRQPALHGGGAAQRRRRPGVPAVWLQHREAAAAAYGSASPIALALLRPPPLPWPAHPFVCSLLGRRSTSLWSAIECWQPRVRALRHSLSPCCRPPPAVPAAPVSSSVSACRGPAVLHPQTLCCPPSVPHFSNIQCISLPTTTTTTKTHTHSHHHHHPAPL